jgi:hypothetical protein
MKPSSAGRSTRTAEVAHANAAMVRITPTTNQTAADIRALGNEIRTLGGDEDWRSSWSWVTAIGGPPSRSSPLGSRISGFCNRQHEAPGQVPGLRIQGVIAVARLRSSRRCPPLQRLGIFRGGTPVPTRLVRIFSRDFLGIRLSRPTWQVAISPRLRTLSRLETPNDKYLVH